MSTLLAYILLPLAWLYGLIVWIRKALYRSGIFTRSTFDFPIICVGNLTAGGTGKTPHIEWLISNLQSHYKLAVLSRGYKRKSSGYILATVNSTPEQIGDEPFQIKRKFPTTTVAVAENRVLGVPYLLGDEPGTDVILMDDGFQHLSIKAGFNIILCDYNRPYYNDFLLPAGLLREAASGAQRADVILVTKCPENLSLTDQQHIIHQLQPTAHQSVFFSCIKYQKLVPLTHKAYVLNQPNGNEEALALAGIANPTPFIQEVTKQFTKTQSLVFSDHQHYTDDKIQQLAASFRNLHNGVIITTEKDAVKLAHPTILPHLNEIPIWYLPIGVSILNQQNNELLARIHHYIKTEQLHANA